MAFHKAAPIKERFESKVMPEPNSGCWLWTGGINEHGYGIIGKGGGRAAGVDKAHRVSYRLYCGDPTGSNVLHKCDNPYCVNPAHLFLGSLSDNMRDCVAKGRNFIPDNRGERATWAKLTYEAVAHIRKRELTGPQYARLYGCSKSAIYEIWRGKNWRDSDTIQAA